MRKVLQVIWNLESSRVRSLFVKWVRRLLLCSRLLALYREILTSQYSVVLVLDCIDIVVSGALSGPGEEREATLVFIYHIFDLVTILYRAVHLIQAMDLKIE